MSRVLDYTIRSEWPPFSDNGCPPESLLWHHVLHNIKLLGPPPRWPRAPWLTLSRAGARLAQVFAHHFSLPDPMETLSRFYKAERAHHPQLSGPEVGLIGPFGWLELNAGFEKSCFSMFWPWTRP